MNKQRRKAISETLDKLRDLLADAETYRDEEQDYFDSMPESFQSGDKGNAAEEAINYLTEACDGIETAISSLESVE